MREQRPRFLTLAAVAALTLGVAACGDDEDSATDTTSPPTSASAGTTPATDAPPTEAPAAAITIADAWSRQPAEGQTVTAVYGVLTNPTDADVTVVAASTPVTDTVELHETIMNDDGTMTMRPVEGGFVIPAGGTFAFESGGPHIMLLDIVAAEYPTDEVEVTLEFDAAEPLTFMAEVRAIDGEDMGSGMDMGSSDSSSEMSGDMSAAESGDHHGVDAEALHELDEELNAGTLDAERQRAVVAEAIAVLEEEMPAAGSPEADLLGILQDLDAALAAGDVEAAAAAATAAHDASHDLEHHEG